MRIGVCMKSVADGETEISGDGEIQRSASHSGSNPSDKYALETALSIKEQKEAEISVFTMGPDYAKELLSEAAKLGADKIYLLSDPAFRGADTFATSLTLCAALTKTGPYDLILCGEKAIDGETGQVPGELAAMLGFSCCMGVTALKAEENRLICRCLMDEETIEYGMTYPAVLGISCGMEGIIHPAVPSLKSMQRARRMEACLLDREALGLPEDSVGLKGSKTQVKKVDRPKWERNCERMGDVKEGVKKTWELLKEAGWEVRP